MSSWLFFFSLVLAVSAAPSGVPLAPLYGANSPHIPNEYIVVFRPELDPELAEASTNNLLRAHSNGTGVIRIMDRFRIGSFGGFSAYLDDQSLLDVRKLSTVKYVEFNQIVTLDEGEICTLQRDATWGLVRTTWRKEWVPHQPPLPENELFSYEPLGEGVDAYVIDTGIETTHPDFGGRAKWGIDVIDNPSPETDLYGHGTHVAGTIMSDTYGLARKATSIAVRVLDHVGSGTIAGIIEGIEWVAGQHKPGKKSVANMSLGTSTNTAMNDAVNAAVDKGVVFAVSAGNNRFDACNKSPASAENAITVAASDYSDTFASFSNYGSCVDIIAPGVDIKAPYKNGGYAVMSGTSMAAPHVAGIAAVYLSTVQDITPSEVKALMKSASTNDAIKNVPGTGTPNQLLFNDCK